MEASRSISFVMEGLVIQVALEVWASAGKSKEAFKGFNVREVLIGGRNDFANASTLDGSLYVFEQQNKASLLNEADRKAKGGTLPQVISNLF
jgi:hypothetical protein